MEYQRFTKIVKQQNNNRVKALSIPSSCATTQIPTSFSTLLPDIINIMHDNIKTLCEETEVLALFGFQVTSIPLTSELPQKLNRSIDENNPDFHFCCNLSYLALKTKQLKSVKTWNNAKSIVVDFTTGTVMDATQYLHQILEKGPEGNILGHLDQTLLDFAWKSRNKHN